MVGPIHGNVGVLAMRSEDEVIEGQKESWSQATLPGAEERRVSPQEGANHWDT